MLNKTYKKYRYSLILLRELVATDFRVRYQSSVLGYMWSLLRPLFLFIILYLIFAVFLGIGRDIQHWPIALLLGIVLWNFFTEVTSGGLGAVVNRGSLLRKLNFPRYIVVISGTISAFINLMLSMVIIVIFMVIDGVEPSWTMLLFPLVVLQLFIFSLGMAFFLGALNVKFRDTKYIWEILSRGLFYASAILYPISRIVEKSYDAAVVMLLSPAAQTIQDARYLLVNQEIPTMYSITENVWLAIVPIIISIVVFIVGALYFRAKSPYFAEDI